MARANVELLLDLIGKEALALLVERFGGLTVRIPARTPFSGELAELPAHAQERLAYYYGGGELYVPKCEASRRAAVHAQIRAEYDAGVPVRQLARQYGYTERYIYHILSQADDHGDRLF